MALKNYSATSLIGGGSGSLDSIDGTNLQDKDSCMVFSAATFYFYTLDDNSGAAESSPDVITPDTNAGNKRWILIAALGAGGVIYLSNAGLYLADTDASHDLIFKTGSNLTADRILTITTGDAARTLTLSGNPTLSDWFDQAVKAASSPTFAGVTLGNTGLHLLDSNASHDLIIKPGSDLTADKTLTLTTGDSDRTITLSGNPTLSDWFDQTVKAASSPIFNTITIGGTQISATGAEINTVCDGITATATKLNAVGALHDQKIWVYANVAPTGWNIVSGTTDALLACKGGSNAYNATGGTQVGTWTQPNHTHGIGSYAGPSHTHTGPNHTHTGPSHTHSVPRDGWGHASSGSGVPEGRLVTTAAGTAGGATTSNTSGAAGTGATGAAGTGVTGASGSAAITGTSANGATTAAYRPLSNLGIIIEKT